MRSLTLRRGVGAGFVALALASLAILSTWDTIGPERLPSGWRAHWASPPFQVNRYGAFAYGVSPAASSFMVATSATRYVATTGCSDANTGLLPGSPKCSIWSASLAAGGTATTIVVAPGTYDASTGWVGVTPTGDQNVVASSGRVRVTLANLALSWTPDLVVTDMYSASVSGAPYDLGDPYGVIDESQHTTEGLGTWLTPVATAVDVAATQGTWAIDGVLHVAYVRLVGGRAPDSHVLVMPTLRVNGILSGSSRKLYVRGVDFLGGARAFHVVTADTVTFDDVTFRYANLEGLGVFATGYAYVFGSYADENNADGFQYDSTGVSTKILEYGCTGRRNGKGLNGDPVGINNGSTSHAGATIVRVNGYYAHDDGPLVADVGDSWSLNYGVTVEDSTAANSTQRVGFWANGSMWLRECAVVSAGLTDDVYVEDADDHGYVNGSRYGTSGGLGALGGWPQ